MSFPPPPSPAINPYAAPEARVEDIPGQERRLASPATRFLAMVVDGLIFLLPFYAVMGLLMPDLTKADPAAAFSLGFSTIASLVVGAGGMIAIIATNWVLLHRHGQTIAKRMFGIKVVRSNGERCSLARILLARWLPITVLTIVPFVGIVLALVDALMIFRRDRRCLHDLVADTIVVTA